MFGPAIIIFRETLEAALVLGIVAAATRGVDRRGLWLCLGVLAGLIGSAVIAYSVSRYSCSHGTTFGCLHTVQN